VLVIGVVLGGCVRVALDDTPACRCDATHPQDGPRPETTPPDLQRREQGPDLDLASGSDLPPPDAHVDRYLRFSTTKDYARLDGALDWGVDFTVSVKIRLTTAPASFKDYITCFNYDPLSSTLSGWEVGFDTGGSSRWWIVNHDTDPYPNKCSKASTTALTVGSWHLMTLTFDYTADGPVVVLYANAVPVAQGTASTCQSTMAPGPLPPDALRLGGMDDVKFDADNLRVFDRALSASEVAALHTGQVPAGVVLHWDTDEGGGATLYDATGNGHSGTLYNSRRHAY